MAVSWKLLNYLLVSYSYLLGINACLLESATRCLDTSSVRALSELRLDGAARTRLDVLAQKANEGRLTPEEGHEYERFIDISEIISTLRLKAERIEGPNLASSPHTSRLVMQR